MKKLLLLSIYILTILPFNSQSQCSSPHCHVVNANPISFSPDNLTIDQGDTVVWANYAGGFHNVNADPTQGCAPCAANPVYFYSGAPTNNFIIHYEVFNTPGSYEYQCDPHVGMGMTGTIVVNPASSLPVTIDTWTTTDVSCATGQGPDQDGTVSFTVNNPTLSWYTTQLYYMPGAFPIPVGSTTAQSLQGGFPNLQAANWCVGIWDSAQTILYDSICFTISDPPLLIDSMYSVDNNCGSLNGEAGVFVNGGTPPYSHNWSGPYYGVVAPVLNIGSSTTPNGDNSFLTSQPYGWYIDSITDAAGCWLLDSVLIDSADINIDYQTFEPGCTDSNGMIVLTTDGVLLDLIVWRDSDTNIIRTHFFTDTVDTLQNIPAGNYFYQVQLAGCAPFPLNSWDSVIVLNGTGPVINANIVDVSCYGYSDATFNATVTGNGPIYFWDWNLVNAAGGWGDFSADTFPIYAPSDSGLSPAVYGVFVNPNDPTDTIWADSTLWLKAQDGNGCIVEATFEITQPDSLIIRNVTPNDISCCCFPAYGSFDGSIDVDSVTGGTPPYYYSYGLASMGAGSVVGSGMYNPDSTDHLFDSLASAAWYYVDVLDDHACYYRDSVYLNQVLPIQYSLNSTNVSNCINFDGSITINNISGGTPFPGIPPHYNITLFDANGIVNSNPVNGAFTFTGLSQGWYTVEITDDNSCIVDTMVFILDSNIYGCTDSTAFNYDSIANCDDGSCFYNGNTCNIDSVLVSQQIQECPSLLGILDVYITGATPAVDYQIVLQNMNAAGQFQSVYTSQWNAGTQATFYQFTSLTAGVYRVLLTDITCSAPYPTSFVLPPDPCIYSSWVAFVVSPPNIIGFSYIGAIEGCCYYVSDSTMSWTDANTQCINNGGNLLAINSQNESDSINILLGNIPIPPFGPNAHWLGLIDGNNTWENGDPLSYTNYDVTYNQVNGQYMYIQTNGFWDNSPNNGSQGPLGGIYAIMELCPLLYGCTDVIACNYDSLATVDDGSCIYSTTGTSFVTYCDEFIWNGTVYDTSGSYTNIFTASNGCDSIHTLNLTIFYTVYANASITACDSYTDWFGQTYTTSGSYILPALPSVNGCDSIVTLNLIINNSSIHSSFITSCDSYIWDGVTYTSSGTYTNTYLDMNSCDSLHTLNLTIVNSNADSSTVIACDFYVWDGVYYTTSGLYTNIYTNVFGCDSIHTLNLIINNSSIDSSSVLACNSYIWDGVTYIASGLYTNTYVNAVGCDSIHILNLTINTMDLFLSSSSVICHGDTNGSLIATTIGGTPPYQYSLGGGILQSSGTFLNLSAGTYYIDVSDSDGCIMTQMFTITQPPVLLASLTSADTTLTAFATGGIPPYMYQIFGPSGFMITNSGNSGTPYTTGFLISGNYNFVLTDGSGCVDSTSIYANYSPNEVLNINNSQKVLINITDVLGRVTKKYKNQTLFYIYDDGTVEKRITID